MKPTVTMHNSGSRIRDRINRRITRYANRFKKNRGVLVGLPRGTEGNYDGKTVPLAVIGAVQEFGSADGRIPERSFLRIPLQNGSDRFRRVFVALMPRVARGEMTMHDFMEFLGNDAVGVSREAIQAGIAPANAQSTINKKGSDTPLIDTGQLWQSITHKIEE
ncbi:hypothetical protein [Carnimonas bestiolae]|uniref:hypothetical protein n=1 Tax=Carnimonas bestiolae TaxID=3402172 RepID=UPI003F4ABBF7